MGLCAIARQATCTVSHSAYICNANFLDPLLTNYRTLARIGALLTVVALAVDPFTQNTIATSDCQILESNQTAHIPIAREYHDPGSFRAQLTNFTDGDFILWGDDTRQEASTAIKASVYAGLYGSATTVANGSSVYIPCTGNSCKFPFYSTLAICHKCADASSHVKRACTTGSAGQGNVFQSPCTYSLPNGQSIGSQPLKDDLIRQYNRSMAEYIPTWALANALPSAMTLPNIPGTFTNLSILANVTTKPTCLIGGLSSESICDTLNVSAFGTIYQFNTVAVECSLFPCVRSYSASTVNGNVVETELNRTVGEGDWLISTPSYPVLMPVPFVWLSPDKNCNQSLGGADGPPDCKFRVDTNALRGLGNFFWHFWNGTVSGKDYTHATIDNNIFGALYNRGYTNLTMIDRIIGGIADSMTAVVRKSYAVNILYPDIHGQVFLSDQCIEIRWAWLSLPAIVACATVIMLICTILISITHRDQPIWKSSTLPILFHGLGAADRTEISHSMSLAEMEKKANRVWTKTSGKGDGSDLLTLRSDQG